MIAAPPGLRIEPSYATGPGDGPLWLPPRLRRRTPSGRTEIDVPATANAKKLVYYKGRLFVKDGDARTDPQWYGGIRRVPYHLGLDERGHDGISLRDQIGIWLAGKLERVYGGRFVHQDADERAEHTVIEEVPELGHSPARWAAFWRRQR